MLLVYLCSCSEQKIQSSQSYILVRKGALFCSNLVSAVTVTQNKVMRSLGVQCFFLQVMELVQVLLELLGKAAAGFCESQGRLGNLNRSILSLCYISDEVSAYQVVTYAVQCLLERGVGFSVSHSLSEVSVHETINKCFQLHCQVAVRQVWHFRYYFMCSIA